jgi:tetratricopeptide (TPR) repeat protein
MRLLSRLRDRELPINVTRSLIHSAVKLMRQNSANPELEASVFGLLRSTRDDQRCAGLAAYFAQPGQQLADEATELIAELALRNHSPQHYLTMAEICLQNSADSHEVYGWLAKAGGKLDHEYTTEVTDMAHSLAGTPAAAESHAGLSLAYRRTGEFDRAAEELLWARQAGSELDTGWVAESRAPNLGFYSALLMLIEDRREDAVDRLHCLVEEGAADADIIAAARMKLALLELEQGNKSAAFSLAEAAKTMAPEHPLANVMINSLKQEIFQERLEEARHQEESAERTLVIARLHKENGEVQEAINELQAGIRKGFAQEGVFLELAECFSVAGQHNISRRAYFEALKRLEQNNGDSELMVRALYGLAQEDIALGNEDEAISNLEYLLLIKSDYRDATQLIEQLYQTKKKESRPDSKEVASQVLEQIMSMLGKDGKSPGGGQSG